MIIKSLIISSVLLSSIAQANTATNKKIKIQAKKAIMKVGGTLKKNLEANMKKGGAIAAMNFCALEATIIEKSTNSQLEKGVSVKRITSKPRNQNNMANESELKVLMQFEEQLKNGKMKKMIVKKISDNHHQVYKPLKVGGKCLMCHGEKSSIDKDVYNVISKKYPNDKAIDYKFGELRGAFLVDIMN